MLPSLKLLGKINANITQRKLPTTFTGIRLLEGAKVTHGNNVPDSKHKTRRNWIPNYAYKRLYSASLNRHFKCMLTTSVSRNILKAGGLDNYLFTQDELEDKAVWLRESVKNAHRIRKERGLVAAPVLSERKMMNKTEPWSRELVEQKRKENLQKRESSRQEKPVFEMRNTGVTIQDGKSL